MSFIIAMTVQEIVTVNLAILVVSSLAYIIKKIIKHQCNKKVEDMKPNDPFTLPNIDIEIPTIPDLPPFNNES